MNFALRTGVCISFLVGSAYVQAEEPPTKKTKPPKGEMTAEMLIGYLDKNNDRKLDLEEYILSHAKDPAGEVLKTFQSLDVNNDKRIDAAEAQVMADYANAKMQPGGADDGISAKQLITKMDKNGDGKIARDEAVEDVRVAFGDLDANSDGFIDIAEAAVMAKFANQQAKSKQTTAKPAKAKPGTMTAKLLISYMDKDGDNKISKAEASDDLKRNFQFVDTDGDGFLDIKETKAVAEYLNKL